MIYHGDATPLLDRIQELEDAIGAFIDVNKFPVLYKHNRMVDATGAHKYEVYDIREEPTYKHMENILRVHTKQTPSLNRLTG